MDGSNLRLFDVSAASGPLYVEHFVVIDHRSARSGMDQGLGNHLSDNARESVDASQRSNIGIDSDQERSQDFISGGRGLKKKIRTQNS